MANTNDQRFSSRLGLILSVLGIAVGTGNIWRFPRIAATNSGDTGAGAFLVAWVIFLFAWSIPLIIAEYALGRKGRMGVVGTFARVAGERFAWMGAFVGFVATAIMFYYSVVAGWCVFYFIEVLTNPLPLTTGAAQGVWDGFQAGGWPVAFHALAMGLGVLAVWKGVASIERVNKVLIPTLFAIVLVALGRTLTLDGAFDGVRFLFTPEWATLARPRIWLEALTQNAWDTGAGWGLILTYGAYMQARHGVVKNAFITGIGNNTVSLLAAIIIFGTVFAILGTQMSQAEVLEVMKTSGPAATGLTFIWMPQLFAKMPAGSLFAVLFFLGLSFAAFSSLISMIELATRVVVDLGWQRRHALALVGGMGFVLGLPSAVHLGFFENQDFVWGVALMISGAFVAFAVIRYGPARFRRDVVDNLPGDWNAGPLWDRLITFVIPPLAVVLLAWWLSLSATVYAPDSWYDPTSPFSVMTCVVQWGGVLLLLLLLNRWLARRTLATPVAAAD
ncbi:sodium-dependent transporter [Rhodocaloribacter litoris]|uniref:sodium-dependent transporter n=1 Tax=Rhodocaloribacter litoris TaxID=2558931 RepID=UPI001422E8EE|nr:sodium-dependent transporter [Rhodocaloribacter litoris]QXD15984.1 sodium-dependent transporter [Rhodocaloribacter litoris]GIV59704.1 MAG: Na+-dependent transporter [Rhodothermaceae bacterium]